MREKTVVRFRGKALVAVVLAASVAVAGSVADAQTPPTPSAPDSSSDTGTSPSAPATIAGAATPDETTATPPTSAPTGSGPVGGSEPATALPAVEPSDPTPLTVPGLSSAFARTELVDGVLQTRLSTQRLNYQTADGEWAPIDTKLVPAADGRGWSKAADSFQVVLPAQAGDGLVVDPTGKDPMTFRLAGAADVAAAPSEQSVRYDDVLPGVGQRFDVTPGGVKETLIVDDASQSVFHYDATLPAGVALRSTRGGVDAVRGDEVVMQISAPVAVDAAGVATNALSLTADGSSVELRVDPAWSAAPDRKFPVEIDPSYTIPTAATSFCTLESGANANVSACGVAKVGYNGTAEFRAVTKFDLSAIPKQARISSARLTFSTGASGPVVPGVILRRVTQAWGSGVSWNKASTGVSWTAAGGTFETSPPPEYLDPGYTNVFTSDSYKFVPVQMLNDMVDGVIHSTGAAITNNGFLVKMPSTSGTKVDQWSNSDLLLNWEYPGSQPVVSRQMTDRISIGVDALRQFSMSINLFSVGGIGPLGTSINLLGRGNLGSEPLLLDTGAAFLNVLPDGSVSVITTPSDTWSAIGSGFFAITSTGTFRSPHGVNAQLTKSGSTYTLRDNESGITRTFTGNVLTSIADTNGNTMTYTYVSGSSPPAVASITDTQGRQFTFSYTGMGGNYRVPSSITDVAGSRTVTITRTTTSFTNFTITDAAGHDTTVEFDTASLGIVDPDNRAAGINYSFAGSFDPTARIDQLVFLDPASVETSTWSFISNSDFSQTTVTDPNSGASIFTVDVDGQVTKAQDPLGHTRETSWTPDGKPLTRTDGLSGITTYTYNTNQTLASIQSPGGSSARKTQFGYPTPTGGLADYQPTTVTDPQNNQTTLGYDAALNVKTVTSPMGLNGAVTNGYQGGSGVPSCGGHNGQLCRTTDANGNLTTYAYNAAGNLTSITPPAPLAATSYTYDAVGRPATIITGAGTATNTFDNLDRITKVSYTGATCTPAAGTCIQYTYDNGGHLLTRVDKTGTATFTYDSQARPKTKVVGSDTATASYDLNGNLTSYVDPNGTLTYAYDAANRLTKLAEPGGSCPATPAWPNATKCTGYEYNNNDQRTKVKYPNGQTINDTYDPSGRPLTIIAKNTGGTTLVSRTYTYNVSTTDTGLRQTVTDEASVVTSYSYDTLNRLTGETIGGTPKTWTYDNNGNRLTQLAGGVTTNYSYNAVDELCWLKAPGSGACTSPPAGATTFGYDNRGNQTSSSAGVTASAYSVWNQQTSTTVAGVAQTYGYADIDATERTTAGATSFLNGMMGIVKQVNGATTIKYNRDPYGNLLSAVNGSTTYYYTTDAVGSTILATDQTGATAATYKYDAWGNITATSGTWASSNPWRFQGGYYDTQTGYTKFGTRYYNPTTGRWTQPDPVYGQPRYAFAGNNPIGARDPSGYAPWDTVLDVVDTTLNVTSVVGAIGCIESGGAGCIVGGAAAFAAGGLELLRGQGSSGGCNFTSGVAGWFLRQNGFVRGVSAGLSLACLAASSEDD
jgi:RHS repeat-associated protein